MGAGCSPKIDRIYLLKALLGRPVYAEVVPYEVGSVPILDALCEMRSGNVSPLVVAGVSQRLGRKAISPIATVPCPSIREGGRIRMWQAVRHTVVIHRRPTQSLCRLDCLRCQPEPARADGTVGRARLENGRSMLQSKLARRTPLCARTMAGDLARPRDSQLAGVDLDLRCASMWHSQ